MARSVSEEDCAVRIRSQTADHLGDADAGVTGDERQFVGEAGCGDQFVGGIGVEVERADGEADLRGERPNFYCANGRGDRFVIESLRNAIAGVEFLYFPEDDSGNAPLLIAFEDAQFVRSEASLDCEQQDVRIKIQHPSVRP